jgi:cytoskeletal protein CcmA (bactofilin family)
VNGDLSTAQIIIEDGAYFKGSIEIEQSAEKEGDRNVFSRTASASAAPAAGAGRGLSNHQRMLRILLSG